MPLKNIFILDENNVYLNPPDVKNIIHRLDLIATIVFLETNIATIP